jgi:glycosyltransferase involved in cell wall biosynthesis
VVEAAGTGVGRHLLDVVGHTRGVDHLVAVPVERVGGMGDPMLVPSLRAAGADVVPMAMTRSPLTLTNARAAVLLRRLVRRRRPAVVHAHSSIGGVLARAALVGTRVPVLYTPNGMAAGRGALAVERVLGHSRTARLIAVSPSEEEQLRSLRVARPERIVMIPNGVTLAAPPPRPLRSLVGMSTDAPLIGFVGRLVPQKAPDVFLAAWERIAREVPEAQAVMIGDGTLAPIVRAAVEGSGGRLSWIPNLQDAAAHLGDLDVLCLASRFEGAPYVPMEALRAGVPVVVSDVVGNRDVIVPEESGLLVPPDDPAALAAAVRRILDDEALRARLVEAGRARVRDRFDVARSGDELHALYAAVAAERR